MKKILVFLALVCVAMMISACCGNNQEMTSLEDVSSFNSDARMLIVHRAFIFPSTYGRVGGACFLATSGEELIIDGYITGLKELKYVQSGDTLFFKVAKDKPEVFRVGFKD